MAGERILIVEDESIVAMDIQLRLEGLGYTVVGTAASGGEALARARDHRPDIVLMDIMLEGGQDGIQTAMALRRELYIPVIYLTAYTDDATLERAKLSEPLGFIHKPLELKEMHSVLEMALYKSRMDRQLRDSEIRYKRLLESVTDYIFTVKVENGRAVATSHNPACVAVTGYSLEEYRSDPDLWFKMVPDMDRPRVLEQARRLLAGQMVQPLEHRLIQKSGTLIWVRNTSVAHFDDHGRLISYDGLVSNITERKNAEEQLKEHARKLAIINRVIQAVNKAENLAVLLDPVLDASLELVQFRCGGIYLLRDNASDADLVCWRGAPDDVVSRLEQAPVAASPLRSVFERGEAVFARQAGVPVPEAQMKWTPQSVARLPLISQERIIGALLMTDPLPHEFTGEEKGLLQSIGRQLGAAIAKMQSEAALRESEEKYRIVSEQSLAGIQIIKNGRLVFVNDGWCKIVGYSRAEALGWGAEEFFKAVHPEDRAFFIDQVRKKQRGVTDGVIPVYDCRFLSRSGATRWVLMHSQPVMFADGRAIVGVMVDITDRKLAEQALAEANRRLKMGEERLVAANQELSEANREKEILLKEIHHRVKNNLQIISSLLSLQHSHLQDAAARTVLRECQNRIKSIAIVHEKLYQSPNLANIDLAEYIRSLTSHLFRTFLVDPASIRLNIAVEQALLNVDQAIPCCLIINELVTNALKYAFLNKQAGAISIALKSDGSPQGRAGSARYVLVIGDDGVGFPGDIDFRNTASLGMQLVLTFVEQLGGTIDMDNRVGTTFTIRFAAGKKNDAPLPAAGVPAEA